MIHVKKVMSLKIVSLNIEKDRHLDRVIPFLKQKVDEGYEVFCLQEVYKRDLAKLTKVISGKKFFSEFFPMCRYTGEPQEDLDEVQGLAMIYVKLPFAIDKFPYYKDTPELPLHPKGYAQLHAGIIVSTFRTEGMNFQIATTHFPVAPNGATDERQKEALRKMLAKLSNIEDLVFCGDFNAPRGREVFTKIASLYKDNIPAEVTTTIDGNYHKAGDLPYVVDGLFTTAHYDVVNVEIVDGLSDHKAITAEVTKST